VAYRSLLDEDGADHDANLAWFPVCLCHDHRGIAGNPDDLYEAAKMDGASTWTRLRTITLPLVLYSIAPIIITQYTFNFNNFNIIYLFNNGGPAVAGANAGAPISWCRGSTS
jgi:ABC-type sugar transport system permease subunit